MLDNRLAVIALVILCIMLCSWVDPQTVDTYTGTIQYADTQGYAVTQLSGNIDYYLANYYNIGVADSGYLVNADANVKSGRALIGGTEYDVRFNSLGGFAIEQTYTTNGYTRTAWINYNLYPDIVPSDLSVPELGIIMAVILVFLLVAINIIMRGVIT